MDYIPLIVLTVLWGCVGIIVPILLTIFMKKNSNRGVLQVSLMLTGATCWLFWVCCYLAQLNPLIGPKLNTHTVMAIAKEWGIPSE